MVKCNCVSVCHEVDQCVSICAICFHECVHFVYALLQQAARAAATAASEKANLEQQLVAAQAQLQQHELALQDSAEARRRRSLHHQVSLTL
jgi:hypothetical protein